MIRERSVVKVPKEAPLEMLAPLGCGIMTGAGAVINSLGAGIDDFVAVFGTGSVGLSAIMAAKLVGAGAIIAMDLVDSRPRIGARAWRYSCDQSADSIGAGGHSTHLAAGSGFHRRHDRECECVARCRRATGAARHARHGRRRAEGLEFPLDVEHVLTGGRTVRGIIEGDANPDVFLPKLVDLFVKGKFPIHRLVTFYPFARVNDAIADALSGKVVKPILRF